MRFPFAGPDRSHIEADLLSAYIDDQVTSTQRMAIEDHLQSCAACRAEIERLRRTTLLLHALPSVAVPRAFTLSESQVGMRVRRTESNWYGGLLRGLGATTAMALVALVAVVVLREPGWAPGEMLARLGATPAVAMLETAAPAASDVLAPTAQVALLVQETPADRSAAIQAAPADPAPKAAPFADAAAAGELARKPSVPDASDALPTASSESGEGALAAVLTAAPGSTVGGAAEVGRGSAAAAGAAEVLTPEPAPAFVSVELALPDAARLAYTDQQALWAVDRASGVRQLAAADGLDTPQIASDGSGVLYQVSHGDHRELWLASWAGGAPRLILDERALPVTGLGPDYGVRRIRDVQWAPGQPALALTLISRAKSAALPPKVELWQLNIATSSLVFVADLGRAARPLYSPDGSRIALLQYGDEMDPQGSLSLLDADGAGMQTVLRFPAGPGTPGYATQIHWLPDGSALWCAIPAESTEAGRPSVTVLHRVSAAGEVQVAGRVEAHQVAWSPDGARLALVRAALEPAGAWELVLASADGSSAQPYATFSNGSFLGWSPDGSYFLYQDGDDVYAGGPGRTPQRLAGSASLIDPRWVSTDRFTSLHDSADGWLLTLRGPDGSAASLLSLPREMMVDVVQP